MSNKVSLTGFIVKPQEPSYHEIDGVTFAIKRDIPYEELLVHIQWAIMLITDSNGYISEPVKIACQELILVAAYTNLDMSRLELATIEQTELYEMYDIVKKTGIVATVKERIDKEQLSFYETTLTETLKSILNYRNSVAGIVELLSSQSAEIKEKLSDVLGEFNDPEKTENVLRIAEFMRTQQGEPGSK